MSRDGLGGLTQADNVGQSDYPVVVARFIGKVLLVSQVSMRCGIIQRLRSLGYEMLALTRFYCHKITRVFSL